MPPENPDYASDGDDEARLIAGQPPDDSSLLVELEANDFPTYFSERDGRLFHSHSTSPYPLPVDGPEQQRLNVTHIALNRLIGANYVGPVPNVLAPEPGRHKIVLDLCTGTGKWVLDMAHDFPHVHFRGLDIVPIATRYPPRNVQFELQDVNESYRWQDATIDIVHARSVSMAVRSYPAVLEEVARVLRPGGLFLSGEWSLSAAFHPNLRIDPPPDPRAQVPRSCRFFDVLNNALATCRGIRPVTHDVYRWLQNSGHFSEVTPNVFYMPIGPWRREPEWKTIGKAFRAGQRRFTESVKPILREAGHSEEELTELIEGYLNDLKTVRGLVSVFHTVYARRV